MDLLADALSEMGESLVTLELGSNPAVGEKGWLALSVRPAHNLHLLAFYVDLSSDGCSWRRERCWRYDHELSASCLCCLRDCLCCIHTTLRRLIDLCLRECLVVADAINRPAGPRGTTLLSCRYILGLVTVHLTSSFANLWSICRVARASAARWGRGGGAAGLGKLYYTRNLPLYTICRCLPTAWSSWRR